MYLKSLELHGFKSFPDKTTLHFDKGSTIIVGPNGSGKSNITDAIRWVLGEISSKNIRGSKLEDVVFIGSDNHRPMSFAEVSITFDDSVPPKRLNCPYDEVTVTRRYFKAGESEYLINKKPCRLKDIHELFMNTGVGREGYSVVGQGKIAEIISKKSEDRRGIFEETAGISKYRYQKNESEKKLNDTQENMDRVLDIFAELESRIKPLERDAEKARKYLDLYDEKKKLDVSLWLYDLEELEKNLVLFNNEFNKTLNELELISDEESALEAQYDRLFEASQEAKQNESKVYDTIRDINKKLSEINSSVSELEKTIAHENAIVVATEQSIEKSKTEYENEISSIETIKNQIDLIFSNIDETNKIITELSSKKTDLSSESENLGKLLDEKYNLIREKELSRDDLRVRCDVLKTNISDNQKRESNVSNDVEQYKNKLEELNSSINESQSTINDYQSMLDKYYADADSMDKDILSLGDKITVKEVECNSLHASSQALESRITALASMLEHFDGFNNSVKFIMQKSKDGELDGVYGPISNLIKVKDKYIIALETAFGSSLQNIVVETENVAKKAISLLKNENAGRATFYPVSNVKASNRSNEMVNCANHSGFVGYADDLIDCDSKFKEVISSIVGRTAIFEDIDCATESAKKSNWKVKIVTLDGQQINVGGSITGGSIKRESGILSRSAQIDSLKTQRNEIESQYSEAEKDLNSLKNKQSELTNQQNSFLENANVTESLLRSERQTLDELEANKNVIDSLLVQLISDCESLKSSGQEDSKNVSEIEDSINSIEIEINNISLERQEIYIQKNEIEDELTELENTINSHNITLAGLLKDAENSQRSSEENSNRAERIKESIELSYKNIEDSKNNIDEINIKINNLTENQNTLNSELLLLDSKRVELEGGTAEFDAKLNDNRKKTKEITDKKELTLKAHSLNESKLEKIRLDKDKIVTHLWDEYELTISTANDLGYEKVTLDDKNEKSNRLNELKSIVKSLGHVNVGAIEEYVTVKERYDYLKEQLDDLTKSKAELENVIKSINDEMEKIFVSTFEKINQYFGETFRELFGGGSAQLELSDPEHVLESGVEIRVAPPGKMIKSLTLLSGGEQAFVAIALIFALIKVNPSPFCIFDEIEAALDEVNVSRVANYVKRFSQEMQIILITHRRGTMETANTLYGVTMPQKGVSKVFTLDVKAVAADSSIARKFTE